MPYVKLKIGHITFIPFIELKPFENEENGRFYTKTKWGETALILDKWETEEYHIQGSIAYQHDQNCPTENTVKILRSCSVLWGNDSG